ncbi:Testis-specific serine/threonine-protein kinase 4 [Lonchura striata]|uniref:Testis-specific serine/threonine-protein kinase 4 n=1 Tax=Lonchura striata TaxID=40157 RepID=A0A218UKB8_9PASE|nr:Testis-specific serine/threonine-protein kinase 4 [Lonchura striata domestica]
METSLNLENIFLDSEETMRVPITKFSRRVIWHDVSGESLRVSPHQGLPTKAAMSQSFCQSYASACTDIQQEKPCDLFLANTWSPEVIFCTLLWGHKPCYATNLQHLLGQTQQSCLATSQPLT